VITGWAGEARQRTTIRSRLTVGGRTP
jgi:hypothetical protein